MYFMDDKAYIHLTGKTHLTGKIGHDTFNLLSIVNDYESLQ